MRGIFNILEKTQSLTSFFGSDYLDFEDWLHVDSMYRSRALDLPGIGHCMVPCVDLANHAAGDDTVANYEKDADGDAVLLLREGKRVDVGAEVTITYGDEKGACEMLFSYGFFDDDAQSAETLFLSLTIPNDDALQTVKMKISNCPPGFKLIDTGDGGTEWTGDFIWLLCVNEDDGLRFETARTVDGASEIEAFFRDDTLSGGAGQLHSLLSNTELWDVYRLRAITLLQQRVFDQLQALYTTQDDADTTPHGDGTDVREAPYGFAMTLRRLEFELMERAYEEFEMQKMQLAQSPVVVRYLAEMNEAPRPASSGAVGEAEDDFS
ncbi:hypothetical protein LTR37_002423 [Vermiconidia calcicola]|uniref:Uncharacterized protein n=1 Tax=Vermiconidia calcicola TaxID=1690605 RepID=A0ACC3NSS8_9PEZI|nr:hypothetical protein LTR37_002423 [Vermiconidia calcicola]